MTESSSKALRATSEIPREVKKKKKDSEFEQQVDPGVGVGEGHRAPSAICELYPALTPLRPGIRKTAEPRTVNKERLQANFPEVLAARKASR